MLCGFNALLLIQVSRLLTSANLVERTDNVIGQAHAVEKEIVDFESGVRGFIITGEEDFLGPYNSARVKIPKMLAILREMTKDNFSEIGRIHQIESLLQQWDSYAQRIIAIKRAGGDVFSIIKTRQGKHLIDTVRMILSDILIMEGGQREARSREVRASTTLLYQMIFCSFVFVLIYFLWFFWVRYRTDIDLRKSEQVYRQMVDSVIDYAIYSLDLKGNIATWNMGAMRLKGYSAKEAIGKHFSLFYSKEDIDLGKPENEIKVALAQGYTEDVGWRYRKDGTRFWANINLATICDDTGKPIGFSKITRDLTERLRVKELEDAIVLRDEFLSVASHELKTPTTSIYLSQQLVRRLAQKAIQAEQQEIGKREMPLANILGDILKATERSEKSSTRLVRLLDELLDVSRIRAGRLELEKEEFDLVELLETIITSMFVDLKLSEVKVIRDYDSTPIYGSWDRSRIEQVLTNLVSNSVKYGERRPINIKIYRMRENVRVDIVDHGMGIPVDVQPKIFQRFERGVASTKISGLGLGLYISQKITQAHGGIISFSSELGKGSTFSLLLPLNVANQSERNVV